MTREAPSAEMALIEHVLRTDNIALLGGTFDPIHLGHLVAAQEIREALGLDRLVLVPAGAPPHKGRDSPLASPDLRLAMVRAATQNDTKLCVWSAEVERTGPSWTVDTLRHLATIREEGAPSPYLVMGADQWNAFHGWRCPEEIRTRSRLVVMTRGGEGLDDTEGAEGVLQVSVPRLDISSTEIRERARRGHSIRYLVPEPVRRIIEIEGLYR